PEMIGMDVDEGELTETGRIRQPVEHLGGLTRRAHPAEAQALTVSGPVDDEGLDRCLLVGEVRRPGGGLTVMVQSIERSEEHTSELQSRFDVVCRLLLEKKEQRSNAVE